MKFQTIRVKPWMYISAMTAIILMIGLKLYKNTSWITEERTKTGVSIDTRKQGIQAYSSSFKLKPSRFLKPVEDIQTCSLSTDESADPAFSSFLKIAKVINEFCENYDVSWFLWGDVSLRLHQIGARLLNPEYEPNQYSGRVRFEIVVASEKSENVFNLVKSLSKEVSTATHNLFGCASDTPHAITMDCCPVISSHNKFVEIIIIGPAIIDYTNNQLRMEDERMFLKYSLKLQRIFPLGKASYYGVQIPVPKEPVYVFSHVVPFKNSNTAFTGSYRYTQGCELLFEDFPNNVNQDIVKMCGQKLQEQSFTSIYGFCSNATPQEVQVPLNKLLESQPNASAYLLEDFKEVIIIDRGTGKYNLTQPNGIKQVKGIPSWSQYGQDRYVDEVFKEKRDGFFLEIGAHDGESISNTIFFEKIRGWNGLLIEAIPSLYKILKSKDRRCYSTNICISTDDDSLVFTVANFLSSSKKYMPDKHKTRIERVNPKIKANTLAYEALVHCKTLTAILDKIGIYHIDYFSLDVEGTELIILDAIDWNKIDIELFTIETDHHRQEIIDFMKSKGYKHIKHLRGDDIFQKIR